MSSNVIGEREFWFDWNGELHEKVIIPFDREKYEATQRGVKGKCPRCGSVMYDYFAPVCERYSVDMWCATCGYCYPPLHLSGANIPISTAGEVSEETDEVLCEISED